MLFAEKRAAGRRAARERPAPEDALPGRCHVSCASGRDNGLVLELRIPAASLDELKPRLEALLRGGRQDRCGGDSGDCESGGAAGAFSGVDASNAAQGRAVLLAMLKWLVGDDGGLLPGRAETAAGDVHHAHLHSILRYIDARVGHGGVTVDDVAQHFHVSRRYAYKLFAMDGLRPARYIADLTLQRCREALADPDCQDRIEQIACRFGFHDASSFSHAFSRCFGMAPRAYRAHAAETTQMEPRRAVPSRES